MTLVIKYSDNTVLQGRQILKIIFIGFFFYVLDLPIVRIKYTYLFACKNYTFWYVWSKKCLRIRIPFLEAIFLRVHQLTNGNMLTQYIFCCQILDFFLQVMK